MLRVKNFLLLRGKVKANNVSNLPFPYLKARLLSSI